MKRIYGIKTLIRQIQENKYEFAEYIKDLQETTYSPLNFTLRMILAWTLNKICPVCKGSGTTGYEYVEGCDDCNMTGLNWRFEYPYEYQKSDFCCHCGNYPEMFIPDKNEYVCKSCAIERHSQELVVPK
jgi:DnaJ-class molecular chaperone